MNHAQTFNPGFGGNLTRPNAIEIDLDRNVALHLRQATTGPSVSDPLQLTCPGGPAPRPSRNVRITNIRPGDFLLTERSLLGECS